MVVDTKVSYPKPERLLPHKPPMLLIDAIEDFKMGEFIRVTKKVDEDEIFFTGHFPGHPILPGVIIVEMMFQTCGLYGRLEALGFDKNGKSTVPEHIPSGRAIKINNVSFHKEVLPGSQLNIMVRPKQKLMGFSVFDAIVTCNEEVVAKGTVTVHIS